MMTRFFCFWLKIISCACFLGSGLKLIFLSNNQPTTLGKSVFKLIVEEPMSLKTEKGKASATKIFGFDVRLSGKSLICIKKSSGPRRVP